MNEIKIPNIKWPWVSRKKHDQEMADYEKEVYQWCERVRSLNEQIEELKQEIVDIEAWAASCSYEH